MNVSTVLQALKGNVALDSSPLHAFSNVTTLRLIYEDVIPEFAFALHFPTLSDLSLQSLAAVGPDPSQRHNLAGVALRSLAVDDGISISALAHAISLDGISVLRLKCDSITWLELANDNTDFSLRLIGHSTMDTDLCVIIVPTHRRWCRINGVYEWRSEMALPLAEKPGGIAHLTYLRLDNGFLHAFLSVNSAFPSLKDIQVDFRSNSNEPELVWPPDMEFLMDLFRSEHRSGPTYEGSESPYNVPCPALEEPTLFALDGKTAVRSSEVAFLGRALGQLAHPKRPRASGRGG